MKHVFPTLLGLCLLLVAAAPAPPVTCTPLITFTEGFETTAAGSLPACWEALFVTAHSTPTLEVLSYGGQNGGQSLYLNHSTNSAAGDYIILVSPELDNLAAGTHRLEFAAFPFNDGALVVGTLSDPLDGSTFTPLQTLPFTNLYTYTPYEVDLTGYTGTDRYLGIRSAHDPALGYTPNCYLDNLHWVAAPTSVPPCVTSPTATLLESGCNNLGLRFDWGAVAGADGYRVRIGTSAGADDVQADTVLGTATRYTLYPTDVSTTYHYAVTAYNTAGDAVGCSEQTTTTGSTACYCTATTAQPSDHYISRVELGPIDHSTPGTGSTYTDYPHLDADQKRTEAQSLRVTIVPTTNYSIPITLYVYADWNQDSDFLDPGERLPFGDPSYYTSNPITITDAIVVPATATLGTTRLRLRASGSTTRNDPCFLNGEWTEDYRINVLPAPPCTPPQSLTTSDHAGTSVGLAFQHPGATDYTVEYGPQGFAPGNGTTLSTAASPVSLTGLSSRTAYEAYVSANCGTNGQSTASAPVRFNTYLDCTAATSLPLAQLTTASLSPNGVLPYRACQLPGVVIGEERLYRFTAPRSGVYTLAVTQTSSTFLYSYAPVSTNCNQTAAFDCIGSIPYPGDYTLGPLSAGQAYYLLVVNNSSQTQTQQFELKPPPAVAPLPASACLDLGVTNVNGSGTPASIDVLTSGGEIVATLSNAVDLNSVTVKLYGHQGAVRGQQGHYASRNITFQPVNQPGPGQSVEVTLYLTDAELQALLTASGATVGELQILHVSGGECSPTYNNDGTSLPVTVSPYGDDWAVSFTTSSFSEFFLAGPNAVLPVTITAFDARPVSTANEVRWRTALEQELDYFAVERSADGRTWIELDRVAARGTDHRYYYTDARPPRDAYYRLRSVDTDGSTAYTEVVSVRRPPAAGTLIVVPHPVRSAAQLRFALPQPDRLGLTLTDPAGRVVYRSESSFDAGAQTWSLDLAAFPAGLYLVTLRGATYTHTGRLLKH